MKLIIGLGNPGKEYAGTRHNVGFVIVSRFADDHGTEFRKQAKFRAEVTELSIGDEKVIIAKPTTFYNLAGESYRLIRDYYKIAPDDTMLIHDELALSFGTLRTRRGGSDAGNNGIKSIIAHDGQDALRLRVGIANELQGRIDNANFVLSKFSPVETELFHSDIMQKAIAIIDDFIKEQHQTTTHVIAPNE